MLMILRGKGTMPLGPSIGDPGHALAERKSVVEDWPVHWPVHWPVLRMAIAPATRSRAIPRPRFNRPGLIRAGITPHAPTGEVCPHG